MSKNVVLLCASPYSAYSVSVATMLLENDINIKHIYIKNMFNRKRIIQEFRQSGFALIGKIFQKIFLQKLIALGYKSNNVDGFTKFYKDRNVKYNSIVELGKINNIGITVTDNFHDEKNIKFLNDTNPDLIVFTGGGLIRKSLLQTPKIGVINCHMGILPLYRGMDSTNWAILHNDYNKIGFTTHLMDRGVDTGPIIKTFFVDTKKHETPLEIDKEIEYRMANAVVEGTLNLLEDKVALVTQKDEDGKQFFVMDKDLKSYVNKLYKKDGLQNM